MPGIRDPYNISYRPFRGLKAAIKPRERGWPKICLYRSATQA